MAEKTVLFANPSAQSGKASEWIDRAREYLVRAGIEHNFVETMPEGQTVELVRRVIDDEQARQIIYMGGDGTFAEIAKGILLSQHAASVAMGMLPTGTANDQGKSFGLGAGPGALEENVRVIAEGVTTLMDVGRIQRLDEADQVSHSDLFFDSASVGWGAAVLATRNHNREWVKDIPVVRTFYRDHLVYAGAMIQEMLRTYTSSIKFNLELEVDGKVHQYESLLDVIVKNTHIFGGEWVLSPDAQTDDGFFEVIPIAGRRDFSSKMLATLRHSPINEDDLRKIGIQHSEPVQGTQFVLTVLQPGATKPPAAQIDGEEFPGGEKFRIDVLQRMLRVIVPREHA